MRNTGLLRVGRLLPLCFVSKVEIYLAAGYQ